MTAEDIRPHVSRSHPSTAAPFSFSFSPTQVAQILGAVVTFLVLAHFVAMYAKYALGHDYVFGLVRKFDVLQEASIPTWYSTATLLACSGLLAMIARAERASRNRFARRWLGLAVVFLYLSMDEASMIHETVQAQLRRGIDRSDALYGPASVAFPALLALSVLVAYLRFLAALPRKTGVLFVAAGAVFVGGALGIDYVGELHKNLHGENTMTYAAWTGVEEACEMLGIVIFIYALLDYMRARVRTVSFTASGR